MSQYSLISKRMLNICRQQKVLIDFFLSETLPTSQDLAPKSAMGPSSKELDWLLFDVGPCSPSKSERLSAELHSPARSPIRGMRGGV
jgi:hypothetical protein